MAEFADQIKIKLILQLIKDISIVLHKLLKYFNGTALSTFTVPSLLELIKNLYLNSNDS